MIVCCYCWHHLDYCVQHPPGNHGNKQHQGCIPQVKPSNYNTECNTLWAGLKIQLTIGGINMFTVIVSSCLLDTYKCKIASTRVGSITFSSWYCIECWYNWKDQQSLTFIQVAVIQKTCIKRILWVWPLKTGMYIQYTAQKGNEAVMRAHTSSQEVASLFRLEHINQMKPRCAAFILWTRVYIYYELLLWIEL